MARTLSFTATAGSLRLFNQRGEPQADIAYTAYQLDGTEPRTPAGDVFLQRRAGRIVCLFAARLRRALAAADRRRAARFPRRRRELKPNAETWLDFTDLVFIDPVETGYSRFVSADGDVRKHFFSVDGDVNALAVVIRRYLEKYDRLLSPKFIVGESYGGIRGPEDGARIANPAGRRRQRIDPDLAAVRFPRIRRHEPFAIRHQPAFDGGDCARGQTPGHARRYGRCRDLRAGRFSRRPDQGRSRQGGDDAACRPRLGADGHRPGRYAAGSPGVSAFPSFAASSIAATAR